MSSQKSAVIALVIVAALVALIGLTGAGTPQSNSRTPLSVYAQSLPTPTLTLPPTATLARRDFNEPENIKFLPTVYLPGRGPVLTGDLVYSGRRLDVYVGNNTFSAEEVAALGVKAEGAISYLQKRFDVQLTRRLSAGVYSLSQAPGRGTRGIAYTYGDSNVRIYYGPDEDLHDALVVLTHEIGHALQAEAYGSEAQSRADIVLLEGLATWISGEYWLTLSDADSFQALARAHYHAGYNGNLATISRRDLNTAYEMWAGFIEYLARTYGWEKFNLLYVSGRGRGAGTAEYEAIYGKTFEELYTDWYATLE